MCWPTSCFTSSRSCRRSAGAASELRFEQPVEAEQRRVARELVLDERARRLGPFLRERQREHGVEQVERRILLLIGARARAAPARRCPTAGRRRRGARRRATGTPDSAIRSAATRRSRSRTSPCCASRSPSSIVARAHARYSASASSRWPRAAAKSDCDERGLRELAVVVRDLLEVRPLGDRLHAARHGDRLRPVLLLLVDRDQEAERRVLERRAVELA